MASVVEVLREEIVGLVKTREAALDPSEKGAETPSPLGEIATSSTVFPRRSNDFIASFESSSDCSSCSFDRRRVLGLPCGDANIPLPSLLTGPRWKSSVSVSDVFLMWLIPSPSSSAGVFAWWEPSVGLQLDSGE